MIAASAEPVFIMPLAVPENSWPISIGTAHIGPMLSSAKKKPADKQASDTYRSCANINGTSDRQVIAMQPATIKLRARRKSPVRR